MWGANKLTAKMEISSTAECFSHGTFERYVFMLSTRFVRTSGNNFNCLTKHGATLFSQHLEAYLLLGVMMNMLAIRYFFPNAGN